MKSAHWAHSGAKGLEWLPYTSSLSHGSLPQWPCDHLLSPSRRMDESPLYNNIRGWQGAVRPILDDLSWPPNPSIKEDLGGDIYEDRPWSTLQAVRWPV